MTCWVGSSYSSRHPAKFVDLVPCENEDKIFLMSRDHAIEVSREFVGEVPSSKVTTLLSLPYESGNMTLFICHVTTISKCHVNFWMEPIHPKLPPC